AVRLPPHFRLKRGRIRTINKDLHTTLQRDPTPDEIAKKFNLLYPKTPVSSQVVEQVLSMPSYEMDSIDQNEKYELLENPANVEDIDKDIMLDRVNDLFLAALRIVCSKTKNPSQNLDIVLRHLGIAPYTTTQTHEEIAHIHGCSREWVRVSHVTIMKKVREYLVTHHGEELEAVWNELE
ncbi:hypothetical protein C5B42_03855, partial [Candidatus Cerribacteria bacterium 'Amazon FNV 2010 28 9']